MTLRRARDLLAAITAFAGTDTFIEARARQSCPKDKWKGWDKITTVKPEKLPRVHSGPP